MQALSRSPIASLLPSGLLASSALFAALPANAYTGGGAAFNGKGFDTSAAPSTAQMQSWCTSTPWSFVGIYVGGNTRACSQPNLTAAWMNTTNTQGRRHQMIWVGRKNRPVPPSPTASVPTPQPPTSKARPKPTAPTRP